MAPHQKVKKKMVWKYNYLKYSNDINSITILSCRKETKGVIFRAKQHQIGKKETAERCLKLFGGHKKRVWVIHN